MVIVMLVLVLLIKVNCKACSTLVARLVLWSWVKPLNPSTFLHQRREERCFAQLKLIWATVFFCQIA